MSQERSILKGVIAGLAAGFIATVVMDQFQKSITPKKSAAEEQKEKESQKSEGATVKIAQVFSRLTTGDSLPDDKKESAGQLVHYTFGTLMGGVYGAISEFAGSQRYGFGFGTVLFLGGDEVAVPALKLGPSPNETPIDDHAQFWFAHLAYGGTLGLARSALRKLLM